jgi:hypothetical protein
MHGNKQCTATSNARQQAMHGNKQCTATSNARQQAMHGNTTLHCTTTDLNEHRPVLLVQIHAVFTRHAHHIVREAARKLP